jgi:hypothetical protein
MWEIIPQYGDRLEPCLRYEVIGDCGLRLEMDLVGLHSSPVPRIHAMTTVCNGVSFGNLAAKRLLRRYRRHLNGGFRETGAGWRAMKDPCQHVANNDRDDGP